MRTPRTTAVLTKAAVSSAIATTMLGTALMFTTSAATAADSPYKAAVADCMAQSSGGAALRECLLAVAPRRAPRVVKQSGTTSSRPVVRSANDVAAANEASAPVADAAPAPANDPAANSDSGSGSGSDTWAQLRECEASGDYGLNDGSGYYGAYQFDLSTWQSIGYEGYPHQASPAVQDEAARVLQSQRGWQPWPACSRKLGLR